jgi:tetratricopeptide (TPR) repeat protein
MPDHAGRAPDFPTESIQPTIAEARRCEAAGAWTEALAKWYRVATSFPDNPAWVAGVGTALRVLRRFDEADACYALGVQRFPGTADIAGGYARVAANRGAWNVAATRWQAARTRFPDYPAAAAGLGVALQNLKRLSEAEAVLDAAKLRFPDDHGVMLGHAGIAAARRNWPEAFARWQAAFDRYPNDPTAHVGVGVALRELARLDEADEIFRAASAKFPTHLPVFVNFAWVAMKRRDWPEALQRWELVRERFGEIDEYVRSRGYVRSVARLDELDASLAEPGAAPVPSGAPVPATTGGNAADLLTQFESLGDNCEFGFVQRHAGAEPLGLLRWANIPTHHLLSVLKTRFAGVGEAAFTDLYTEVDGEFWVKDTRYDMRTHTFVFEMSLPDARRARFQQLMAARFRFLKDQLIKDLETAAKIFVLKSKSVLLQDDIEALYDAVSEYAPNWLLYVRASDEQHQPGSVRTAHDRLMIGHVKTAPSLDHPGWRQVCQTAFAMRAEVSAELAASS